MKTLTVTEARRNLSGWLRRAKAGEEIGIIDGNQIVALRPVSVTATDYMESEYGLTASEADTIAKNIKARVSRDVAAGNFVSLEDIPYAPRRPKSKRAS